MSLVNLLFTLVESWYRVSLSPHLGTVLLIHSNKSKWSVLVNRVQLNLKCGECLQLISQERFEMKKLMTTNQKDGRKGVEI